MMTDNKNMELNDEMMAKATGGDFLHLPPVMKYMLIRSAVSTVGRSKALSIIDITNE